MWGYVEGMDVVDEKCMYINGFAFEENDIFYDLILPFLPEDEANTMEGYKQENQE